MVSPPPLDDSQPAPYVLVNRYQLLERIGEGGMGVVWRSFDLDLEEQVAIKFLREDLSTDGALRACFRREVKLARRVTHPNVARVFEFGRDRDLYFLTMEFIEGEGLDAVLEREGTLSHERTLSLGMSICRGLAAAHGAGVVHGDLKPGNVLLAAGRGAVLTDFGIARAMSETLGRSDVGRGTLEYMAPEQIVDEAIHLQSDVYSMGLVLLEMLAGATPWRDQGVKEVLEDKLRGADPDVRKQAPGLAGEWAELITDCLHRDVDKRPADARVLLQRMLALRAVMRHRRLDPGARSGEHSAAPRTPRHTRSPLATGAWPRWLEIVPFDVRLDEPPENLRQMNIDLLDTLTNVRGLRVMRSGVDPAGPPLDGRTQIRGQVLPSEDGVVVAVCILEPGKSTPEREFVVHQPRAGLANLGFELAARIAAELDLAQGGVPLPPRGKLDPVTASLYADAREASTSLRFARAVELLADAIVRAPAHRVLRVEHTLARIEQAFAGHTPVTAEEIARLIAAADALVSEHHDLGEAHLVRAVLAYSLGDLRGAAAVRAGLARAPNLVRGQVLLAHVLLDVGRLPDAERRLDIALALDANNVSAWLGKARLLAYQGQWGEFYAVMAGRLTDLRHRSVLLPRLMLSSPDRSTFEWLEPIFAANADDLPPPLCELGREVVAFALREDDRPAIFERLARHPPFTQPRHERFLAELLCELACMLGDVERALAALTRADPTTLGDWQWIEYSPVLAPLRADLRFMVLRDQVRANADAVAEAVWG